MNSEGYNHTVTIDLAKKAFDDQIAALERTMNLVDHPQSAYIIALSSVLVGVTMIGVMNEATHNFEEVKARKLAALQVIRQAYDFLGVTPEVADQAFKDLLDKYGFDSSKVEFVHLSEISKRRK